MATHLVLFSFLVLLVIKKVYLESCDTNNLYTEDKKESGFRITGYIFKTFDYMNIKVCAKECMVRPRCVSINVHNLGYRCELNERKKENAVIEMNPEWSYSDIDNWPQELVGPCANTTCGNGKRCIPLHDGSASCIINECISDPPAVANAIVSLLNRTVSGVTQYNCNVGYKTSPGDTLNITCTSEGKWTPVNFKCFPSTCPAYDYTYVSSLNICVKTFNTKTTWSAANSICANEGAVLYIDKSTQRSTYIDSLISSLDVWLGAKRISNKMIWQDNVNNNEEVGSNGYTRWNSGEPDNNQVNEDCLIRETNMKWYDRVCTLNYSFVCSTP